MLRVRLPNHPLMKPECPGRQTWPAVTLLAAGLVSAACVISPKETDLQRAVKAHDVEAVRKLLDSGASLNASFQDANGPYELALTNLAPSDPRTVEVLRLMITRMDKAFKTKEGAVGVTTAPRNRPADFVFKSNRPGSTAQDAQSAVELAIRQWSADGVKVLVEHGLTIKSESVSDALVAGAGNGCMPALRVLLDAGADVNRPDRKGDTALRMARRMRNGEVAALLLGHGARAPKPGAGENAQKKVGSLIGSIIAPGAGGNPEDAPGQQWLEGAEVVKHPIGQAAVKLGVPIADLQRGSALLIKGPTAELHVFIPPAGAAEPGGPLAPATAKHTLALDNGTWMFRAES
jgi:uncharacterized protein